MEDCVVEAMNAEGATFTGEDAVVRRCMFRDNGQVGFGANRAHRLLFTECLVENNNTKGFDRGWEAGGDKLVLCRDAVLERSRFVRNRGSGIWFDIGNTNCTVRHCLIADNEDAGIFYEISFSLHAHDNVIIGNGFAATAGAWGAQARHLAFQQPGCVIERNVIAGNREGFNFREQTRPRGPLKTAHAAPGGVRLSPTTWARHQRYPGLREFQSELGIDRGQVLNPESSVGFSTPRGKPVGVLKESYPRGPVPGVLLGERRNICRVTT